MKAKSDPHDKKKFWSRRWATFRSFVKKLFWVFIAFFNFVLSFFFIRVTIAKLVQGTIVESKDLTLILQAKEAIEETATYLKEYLQTANTFDWPAPGSEDTELGVFMGPEVSHGETKIYARVQA
jgi:hypothetical protein